MKTTAIFTPLFALVLAACSVSTEPFDPEGDSPMSKDDARAAGKADQDADHCEEFGWYGDGECDDFCLMPDPDCGQGVAGAKTFAFDFATNQGDFGFKGLFRDVPEPQHAEYLRRVASGLDLGPVPPETITRVGSPEERSHWFMNAGIHAVPDNPGIFGYLLQGVNRSDDMDKYMVREFGPADGLRPNSRYDIVIHEVTFAANDRIGAYGPGGGEARTFEAYVVNQDPYPFAVDFTNHVRFTEQNRPSMAPGVSSSVGGTGVCVMSGSGIPTLPGVEMCPTSGRVPYAIMRNTDVRPLSITTDDLGRLWLMIGGHSGHESLDEYFVINLALTVEGDFVQSSS